MKAKMRVFQIDLDSVPTQMYGITKLSNGIMISILLYRDAVGQGVGVGLETSRDTVV